MTRLHATVSKSALLPVLERAADVADRKSTTPILAHVRLRATERSLEVTATDLDVTYTAAVDLAGEHVAGAVCVSARDLARIVAAAPGELVTLERRGERDRADSVVVAAGVARFTLVGLDASTFPKTPYMAAADLVNVPAASLRELFDRTRFAISNDETRFHLNGVYLEGEGPVARAVATDGHRLIKAEVASELATILPRPGIIVPGRGVDRARRLLDRAEVCAVVLHKDHLHLQAGAEVVSLKLIAAQFPPYDAVIPKRGTTKLDVADAGELLEVVKRAALMSTSSRGVMLTAKAGVLELSSEDDDRGTAADQVAAVHEGAEIAIGVNPKYLREALEVVGRRPVVLELLGTRDPFTIRPAGDTSYVAVTMPMRID